MARHGRGHRRRPADRAQRWRNDRRHRVHLLRRLGHRLGYRRLAHGRAIAGRHARGVLGDQPAGDMAVVGCVRDDRGPFTKPYSAIGFGCGSNDIVIV